MKSTLLPIVLLVAALAAGCSSNAAAPTVPPASTFAVDPADGATRVRLDAAVTLTFAQPADRAVVARGFHLISERELGDTLCAGTMTMTHGTMADCMADTSMMRHMDVYHATTGRMEWNGDGTMCRFQPDSMMTPATRYMLHMDREMMDMVGAGSMGGHGSGMMDGHMMLHFTTMDATDGHDDHHPTPAGARR